MKVKLVAMAVVFLAYLSIFLATERHFSIAKIAFAAPLPAPVQHVALGFLRHFGAEMMFVKAAVFLGAPPTLLPKEQDYAENLTRNFEVLVELYPEFTDAYYLAQSSLAHISPEYAGRTIGLLDRGGEVYPDDLILSFFKGFDHYYYRDEAAQAARIFAELGQRPGAPSWLGHLAAVLSGRDGALQAGLMSLQVMHATEEDEKTKVRYARDMESFKKAIGIQEATVAFQQKYGKMPQRLEELVPEFFPNIPVLGNEFELLWTPPRLRLIRPLKPNG